MTAIEKLIKKAIDDGLSLTIEYSSYSHENSRRVISEIKNSAEYGKGYIEAFCHLRNERRTFKISRIVNATIGATETPPAQRPQRVVPPASQQRPAIPTASKKNSYNCRHTHATA